MRAPAELFLEDYQERLGRVSAEHPAVGGLLPGVRPANRDGKQVSRGICGDEGDAGSVVG